MAPVAGFVARTRGYYPMAIQFLFGGLFSAYAVFYSRSASLTSTALFFVVLVGLLIGNEFSCDRVSNLKLMLALYALAGLQLFDLLLAGHYRHNVDPVVSHWRRLKRRHYHCNGASRVSGKPRPFTRQNRYVPHLPALLVVGALSVFYFLNWIPPVPLLMSFGGMYHNVVRSGMPS